MKRFRIKTLYGKGTLIAFALLYAFLVTLGSTFSWVTSSDQKVNEFTGEMGISAVIVEDFAQQSQWQPGGGVTKSVSACNDGISPGFVRISFEEIVRAMKAASVPEPFEDPEEGVTLEYCNIGEWGGSEWKAAGTVFGMVEFRENDAPITPPAGVDIKVRESPAGAQYNQYAVYQAVDTLGPYRRMTALFSVSGSVLTVNDLRYWGHPDACAANLEADWRLTPPPAAAIGNLICDTDKKISINYSVNVITALTSVAADTGKWYYHTDGFFYYIGKLEPGASTATLMTGLTLDAGADVSYSNMNLQFTVNLQALQLKREALADDWGLASGPLYDHLASFC